MKRWTRRTLLRRALGGGGAVLALPWLESAQALARGDREDRGEQSDRGAGRACLACLYVPNGVHTALWFPSTSKVAQEPLQLSPALGPLEPWRADVTVVRGLALDAARPHGDGPGDHARAAAAFLTCAHPLKQGPLRVGTSMDQVLARALAPTSRLPSLQVGCEGSRRAGDCDSGYACAYSSEISWNSPQTPCAKEVEPRRVFDKLFLGEFAGLSPADRQRKVAERKSLLDFAMSDARALSGDVGARDAERLDQYLSALRELERRLQPTGGPHPDFDPSARAAEFERHADLREHATQMAELIALAFATDRTRVATWMLANEGSNRAFPELDAPEGHHTLSHHGRDPETLRKVGAIDRFYVELLAALVERLARFDEGPARLLDRCLVLYGSGISDGNLHNHDNLPIALAGGAALGLVGGRQVTVQGGTPLANLHLSVLAACGVPQERFADSSGVLGGLFA